MTWRASSLFLAEEVHFVIGLFLPLALMELLHVPFYYGMFLLTGVAFVKEFWWDVNVEGASMEDGAVDLAFYMVGMFVGGLLLALSLHVFG